MPDVARKHVPTPQPALEPPGALGFLELLARALHVHGCPAHQLEETLERLAGHLGIEAQFFSTPTAVFADFRTASGRSSRLLRMEPGEADLGRLRELDELIAAVLDDRLGPAEGELALRAFDRRPALWSPAARIASFALASAAAARFLGGGPGDVLAGGAVGLAVGWMDRALGRRRSLRRIVELAASALAAGLALVASTVAPAAPSAFSVAASVVTVAGLIVLVPGMTLTLAMAELATRNLVSGSARLAGAAVVLFTIGFGVAVGDRVARAGLGAALPGARGPAAPLDPFAGLALDLLALGAIALAFTVLFRARRRDAGWMLLAAALAWGAIRWTSGAFGPGLGALAAAFVVAVAGNLVSRGSVRPAALIHVPGLMLLVPGSLGLRSLGSLLAEDTLLGVQGLVDTSLTAVALATGVLVAHALVPPRRGL